MLHGSGGRNEVNLTRTRSPPGRTGPLAEGSRAARMGLRRTAAVTTPAPIRRPACQHYITPTVTFNPGNPVPTRTSSGRLNQLSASQLVADALTIIAQLRTAGRRSPGLFKGRLNGPLWWARVKGGRRDQRFIVLVLLAAALVPCLPVRVHMYRGFYFGRLAPVGRSCGASSPAAHRLRRVVGKLAARQPLRGLTEGAGGEHRRRRRHHRSGQYLPRERLAQPLQARAPLPQLRPRHRRRRHPLPLRGRAGHADAL
jgi:hypothetical protein